MLSERVGGRVQGTPLGRGGAQKLTGGQGDPRLGCREEAALGWLRASCSRSWTTLRAEGRLQPASPPPTPSAPRPGWGLPQGPTPHLFCPETPDHSSVLHTRGTRNQTCPGLGSPEAPGLPTAPQGLWELGQKLGLALSERAWGPGGQQGLQGQDGAPQEGRKHRAHLVAAFCPGQGSRWLERQEPGPQSSGGTCWPGSTGSSQTDWPGPDPAGCGLNPLHPFSPNGSDGRTVGNPPPPPAFIPQGCPVACTPQPPHTGPGQGHRPGSRVGGGTSQPGWAPGPNSLL